MHKDALYSLGFLGFCLFSGWQILGISGRADDASSNPALFPALVTGLLALLSGVLLLRGYLAGRRARAVSAGPVPATAPEAKGSLRGTVLMCAAMFALLFLYAFCYERLGFFASSAGFFLLGMILLREKRILHAIVIPVLLITAIYLLFTKVMMVYLP